MKPVAEELSSGVGVLEPFQTELSIEDQVDELKDNLEKAGDIPVTLIGYSWGAWLSVIFSAIYPALVEKIILVGSPPFREKYAAQIAETRSKRLNESEREELRSLTDRLEKSGWASWLKRPIRTILSPPRARRWKLKYSPKFFDRSGPRRGR
jgi:pimeloyl-ACP methyl ester carboxylesterase